MNKLLGFFFVLFLILFCGCKDDEPDNPSVQPDNPSVQAEYYVKYEGTVTNAVGYAKTTTVDYTVNTENGTKVFRTGRSSFSQTFGPVKKEFVASVMLEAKDGVVKGCNVNIYVSRGTEPFALKASKSGGQGVNVLQASYTIDY